jgi:hypothetical protein
MNLLKTGRPSTNKEKALKALDKEEVELLTIRLPIVLKKKLKHSAISNNVPVNHIMLNCIKKYIEEEERDGR